MDIKQLVENACLAWEENGFYKPSNTRLFQLNQRNCGKDFLALDGYGVYQANNILEACKIAIKQAPIRLEKSKEGDSNE